MGETRHKDAGRQRYYSTMGSIGKGLDTKAMMKPKGVRITTASKILDTPIGNKILFKPKKKAKK